MKHLRSIITLLAIAAIGFGIYYYLFPPPQKVIRKRLTRLAESISARPEGNIGTMANINRIGSFFHPNVALTLEGFGGDVASVQGRGELQQMALAARQRVSAISVEFYNIVIEVGAEKTNAAVSATAIVKINDDANAIVQELNFAFEKFDRAWVIRSATPAKSLKPE